MPIVSNSSPLIHLGKIGKLDILKRLFESVIIPEAVYKEVFESRFISETDLLNLPDFIKVQPVSNQDTALLLRHQIDDGESEAIALSLEINPEILLLDDSEAREKAKMLGLRVTGTIGVLLKAKQKGIIPFIKPVIREIEESGFWLSKEIEKEILRFAGES